MSTYQAIRIVGGIVPPSFLERIRAGEVPPESLTPASYHLAGNETLANAASRSWQYLRGAWQAWKDMDRPGTGDTRDRWLLPLLRELGYGNVPALSRGRQIGDAHYPISHALDHVPIHLLGPGVALDRRNPGVAGAARAPQAMLQEYLNRTDADLWAIFSNGSVLRLLRDSTALAGSAYLEFDLDAIFDGELYAEFKDLYTIAHSSRLEKRGGSDAPPSDCWIEAWRTEAVAVGTRALDKLRNGVEAALVALGDGFLHHPNNRWLVDALRSGKLADRDYLRALLRLVYRLLFTFVAEDRGALLDPDAEPQAKQRYTDYFATARVRRLSRIRAGGPHPDYWQAQRMVLAALGGDGLPQLAVPALGGLFDPDPRALAVEGQPGPDLLLSADLANHAFLDAVRALAWIEVKGGRRQPVDYRNLGAEELGSVYESLLELIPRVDLDDMTFRLENAAGNDRKSTGSYYTPPALVSALLDTALDPLLDDAVENAEDSADAESRLLALTVCDPASGSGGFLVAAARRMARCLAQVRSGEDEPTPEIVQHALRDVIGRCIYGVDLNDLAAELAKVSLWMEAMEPGKPLGFLDARIRVGNSLIGTTPALLADGIPDAAFREIEGDDKKYAAEVRRQNKLERSGQFPLIDIDLATDTALVDTGLLSYQREVLLAPTDDIDAAREQARTWRAYENSEAVRRAKLYADAWTAAFVWPLRSGAAPPVTRRVLDEIASDPDAPTLVAKVAEVRRLAAEYLFFHWHLEFPEVFAPDGGSVGPDGWAGGFSCLLGNPPWERVKLQEQEFFGARSPEIAKAPNAAARKRMIKDLAQKDPSLHSDFLAERRRSEGVSHMLRNSGSYPLTGRGDVNTYAVFAELFRSLTGPHGRSGIIVPTGIATDATTQHFFKNLVGTATLAALYDFENGAPIFEGVHRSFKFCLLTVAGREVHEDAAWFAFFLHEPAAIETARFRLTPEEITLLNPNTGTCPIFRTRRDAEITLGIYRRVPVLINEAKVEAGDPDGNPWGASYLTKLFDMAGDSDLFRPEESLLDDGWSPVGNAFEREGTGEVARMLPLYQGVMFGLFDHRLSDVVRSEHADIRQNQPRYLTDAEKSDPHREAMPTYWVAEPEVAGRLARRGSPSWLISWRDITSATNERTLIAAAVPRCAMAHTGRLLFVDEPSGLMAGILSTLVCDYVARQKVGGTHLIAAALLQLPTPRPTDLAAPLPWGHGATTRTWVARRLLELTYSAWDMQPFAQELGENGPPYIWSSERRFFVRAELDAAFFHLFGIARDDVDYIMETFPIVKRKDIAAHGEYRTKRVILEMYDAMQTAIDTGVPYQTPIDPPPGSGPRHEPRATARGGDS